MKVKLSQIKVSPTYAQQYTTREIEDLVESMEMKDLLEPLVVTHDMFIISGHRQYFAGKFLGWEEIEVFIRNIDQEKKEYIDIPEELPLRKKSAVVLNEIQQLYRNYTKTSESGNELPGTNPNQNQIDNSKQMESWYW